MESSLYKNLIDENAELTADEIASTFETKLSRKFVQLHDMAFPHNKNNLCASSITSELVGKTISRPCSKFASILGLNAFVLLVSVAPFDCISADLRQRLQLAYSVLSRMTVITHCIQTEEHCATRPFSPTYDGHSRCRRCSRSHFNGI